MVRILAYIITPIGLLAALAAIRSRHPDRRCAVTLLCHWPAQPSGELTAEITAVIKVMSQGLGEEVQVISLDMDALSRISNRPVAQAFPGLREVLGQPVFDEIYYSHDAVGFMYQYLAGAYPLAERVCYGDVLGFVGRKVVRRKVLQTQPGQSRVKVPSVTELSMALSKDSRLIEPFARRNVDATGTPLAQVLADLEILPHEAALIIPVDHFGSWLDRFPLRVVPKQVVLEVIQSISGSVTVLNEYIRNLLEELDAPSVGLLLTQNYAEAKNLSFENEVQAYAKAVCEHLPEGVPLCVKPHPGEVLPKAEALAQALSGRNRVVKVVREYQRYPIELWHDLIQRATVLGASYPLISLKYLYGMRVINPLTDAMIDAYWPQEKRPFRKFSQVWMRGTAEGLDDWDGQGLVFRGDFVEEV